MIENGRLKEMVDRERCREIETQRERDRETHRQTDWQVGCKTQLHHDIKELLFYLPHIDTKCHNVTLSPG